jgi:phospholipase/carboxylesterase
MMASMWRRDFLAMGGGAIASACAANTMAVSPDAAMGRLRARPGVPTSASPVTPGEHALELSSGRDGLLIVPRERPPQAPLVVLLHGATGSARGVTSRLAASALADRFQAVVLAPESRGRTWDAIGGAFGRDVAFLDTALAHTFERVGVDATRVAIGGFSDGASYALSLGLINGDLFTHVMAFSPGFVVEGGVHGKPRIFLSHGTHDEILPIDRTSRRLVPALRSAGYAVDYREFDGPHTVPASMAEAAFEWLGEPAR